MRDGYRVKRKIATVPIVGGSFATIDLPRSYDTEAIFLRIWGTLQVTVLATSVRAESPCQLVPRVELIADGKNTVHSSPFWAISLGRHDRFIRESGARATTPPSGVAVATYAVEAIGIIDCQTPDGIRPKDSNFRTSGLSLYQLRLTFGQPGDCYVGGTVTLGTGCFVDIFSAEFVELPDANKQYTTPIALRKTTYQEVAVTASNPNFQLDLPAGNLVKSVLFRGEVSGEPSTAVLNAIQLQSGLDVRFNLSAAEARALANADHGQLLAGYYACDMTAHGKSPIMLTELWDLTGQVDPKAVIDVTGGANNKVQAVITEYIMRPAAAAA